MKKFFGAIAGYIKSTDMILIIFCCAASFFGIVLLFVAVQSPEMYEDNVVIGKLGEYVLTRQLLVQVIAVVLGIIAAIIISRVDYEMIASAWWIIASAAVFLTVLTYFFGIDTGSQNDKAWLIIPGINLSVQPSELLKIAFIISFSLHLSSVKDRMNTFSAMVPLVIHGMIPIGMVVLQKDFGTVLVFIVMFVVMMYSAGVKLRYFVIVGILAAIVAPFIWFNVLEDYHRERTLIFLHPENDWEGTGYQQFQGRLLIGTGKLFGKGISGSGRIALPERQNDFIFSVCGEAFGFVGCIAVIALLVVIMVRILRISRLSKDTLGSIMCMGLFAELTSQILVNLGMNLCLLPVIGITLPFFSAGGSSNTTLFFGIGLILSVYIHSKPKTHNEMMQRKYYNRKT